MPIPNKAYAPYKCAYHRGGGPPGSRYNLWMDIGFPHQRLDPHRTTWHITFGTYGTRLHGGDRPTVDRQHNQRGQPFVGRDPNRESIEQHRLRADPLRLTLEQARFAQQQMPSICERGGWNLRVCSAADDHIHVLADLVPAVHGEKARRLLKRWLGQAMTAKFGCPASDTWWAEEGSNKPVQDERYLNNAYGYILKQRS